MKYGGAFDSSKAAYSKWLPKAVVPVTIEVQNCDSLARIVSQMEQADLQFPVIIKPDIGERGQGVELLKSQQDLSKYLQQNLNSCKYLIQEYLREPYEYGVFYYRDPDTGHPIVNSVTEKEFFSVIGTGRHTLEQLISKAVRVAHRKQYFKNKYANIWNTIVPEGDKIVLEPIGNHNRGTKFLDKRELITPALVEAIHEIAEHIPDLDYCRFDIKVPSPAALKRGEQIKVLEVNGVNSEPIHIYQPNYGIRRAYKDLFHYMHLIYRISRRNRLKGASVAPCKIFFRDAWLHYKNQLEWNKV